MAECRFLQPLTGFLQLPTTTLVIAAHLAVLTGMPGLGPGWLPIGVIRQQWKFEQAAEPTNGSHLGLRRHPRSC